MAYDPRSDQIVLALLDSRASSVVVTTKSPRAAGFDKRRTWITGSSDGQAPVPTAVTSYAGRVTVAVEPWSLDGPPFLVSGRVTRGPIKVTRIEGAVDGDRLPLVVAASPRRLFVAWTRATDGLEADVSGVWSSWATRPRGREDWTVSSPVRRSRSPYDWLRGVGVHRDGRASLLVLRSASDRLGPDIYYFGY
jgi:hypothetical protein